MDGALVPAEAPGAAWFRCRPYIEAALARAGHTHRLSDVAQMIGESRAHFWPGRRCAVVTEFYDYPRLRACNFWLLGGELKELLAMRPMIEDWAAAQGCTRMLGGGPRRGWGRLLQPFGYRAGWIIYCKDMNP